MQIETLLYTSLNRDDLFEWQGRALLANVSKKALRVDTWEIRDHPGPGGTFTLYAMTIVLAELEVVAGEWHGSF